MNLKLQLEYFLEKTGMNPTLLSRKARVPRQNISNWLMGQSPKDITQVKRVADIFGISVDTLVFGDSSKEVPSESCKKGRRFEVQILREISEFE